MNCVVRYLIAFCLIFTTSGYTKQCRDERLKVLFKQPFVVVPLGVGCQLGMHLKDHDLYLASFPIDWMVTAHFPSFLQLLQDDFQHLIDFSLLEIRTKNGSKRVFHKKYEIELPHVLNTNLWHNSASGLLPNSGDRSEITSITSKYNRRIRRYKKLGDFQVPVYFLRYRISGEEAFVLCELLEEKFPTLDFKLVAINFSSSEGRLPSCGRIIFEYLDPEYDLNIRRDGRRHPAFTKLFKRLGLIN